jgi:hypothetical protein
MSPPRITIQLLIYITMFELHCLSNIMLYVQIGLQIQWLPEGIVVMMKIFKWLHHFSPLVLLYFHPALEKKFHFLYICKRK